MELGIEFPKEVASILNQLGFQVNGNQLEAHNAVVMFNAVQLAFNRIRIAASEGSAVGLAPGLSGVISVPPAFVGATSADPAARRRIETPLTKELPAPDCGFSHAPGATCHHTTRAPQWWSDLDGRPSPNLDPEAWADGGRPDVPLDDPDPEPVSSPPAAWPQPAESPVEPPTPTETRTPGVSSAHDGAGPVSRTVPPVPDPHLADRYPDPMVDPELWDAAVARGDDPDADQWPYPADWSWSSPYPSPWLLKRRARTAEGVAVPALYPLGLEAGRTIDIQIPDVIEPEPDWLDPATRLPDHWLEAAGTPGLAAVAPATSPGE